MAPDRRDAQPAQAVQIQAIPAAGAVTGERMRGSGPGGDGHQAESLGTSDKRMPINEVRQFG